MRRPIVAIIAVALLLGASVSQGGWKMSVHEGATTTEFSVAEIDSLTMSEGWVDVLVHEGETTTGFAVSGIDSVTFHFDSAPPVVVCPAGTFMMGDEGVSCADEHQVTLTRAFHIGQHEVTNQEYLEAVQWAYDSGYITATASSVDDSLDGSTELLVNIGSPLSEIKFESGTGTFYLQESPSSNAQGAYPGGYDPADHPVKMVTWFGAARYCDWLSLRAGLPRAYQHSGDWLCNGGDPYGAAGYRLPTDAEWEYSAQYNDERTYPWGDESPSCIRADYKLNSYTYCVTWTAPVGSYPDAPELLGLSDMAGNVAEWCNDRFALCNLGTDAVIDPVGPTTGSSRVLHGGMWYGLQVYLPCAARGYTSAVSCTNYWGFRVARTAGS